MAWTITSIVSITWDIITHDLDLEILREIPFTEPQTPRKISGSQFGGDAACRRRLAMSRAILVCHSAGRGIWWIEAKGVQKHPTTRGPPAGKELPWNLQMSTVLRLRGTSTGGKEQSLEKVSPTCNKHVPTVTPGGHSVGVSLFIRSADTDCMSPASGPVLGTEDAARSNKKGLYPRWSVISDRHSVDSFSYYELQGFSLMLCALADTVVTLGPAMWVLSSKSSRKEK